MNLEPIPIGTPKPPRADEPVPPQTNRAISVRVKWTWGRTFGFGVGVGAVVTLAVGLLFALARENEWQDRLQKQTTQTPAVPPPHRR